MKGPWGGGERSMGRGHWQERGDEGKREKGGEREGWSYALRPLRQAFTALFMTLRDVVYCTLWW